MKRKNTEFSFWTLLSALYFAAIVLSLIAFILMGLVVGKLGASDIGSLLFRQLASWVSLIGFSAALWLRWRELRANLLIKQLLGRKSLAALAVFGLIASGPFWIPIHFVADNLFDWLGLYLSYLILAGLFVLVPCFLIYSLGKALGEKDMEKEELEEARKY